MLWPRPQDVLKRLGLRAGMTAVDLCCGYGWFTLPMVRLAGGGRITAVDIDPDMIAAARAHLQAHGVPAKACRWITGCAQEMDRLIAPGSCDFVLIANTFHGVPDKAELAAAVHRALKPGGLFAVVNWHRIPREATPVLGRPRGPATELRMTPQQVTEAVQVGAPDLAVDRQVELRPYHYGLVFRKAR